MAPSSQSAVFAQLEGGRKPIAAVETCEPDLTGRDLTGADGGWDTVAAYAAWTGLQVFRSAILSRSSRVRVCMCASCMCSCDADVNKSIL